MSARTKIKRFIKYHYGNAPDEKIGVMIGDIQWFIDHEDKIDKWLELHNCLEGKKGVTIEFPSEDIQLWFLLQFGG